MQLKRTPSAMLLRMLLVLVLALVPAPPARAALYRSTRSDQFYYNRYGGG